MDAENETPKVLCLGNSKISFFLRSANTKIDYEVYCYNMLVIFRIIFN